MIEWQDNHIPMRDVDEDPKDHVYVADSPHIESATDRIKKILDAKYEPANIEVELQRCTHLSDEEKQMLRRLLNRHYRIFDGSLGKWTGTPYHIELVAGAQPYHARPFPIPHVHEATLRLEVERLCQLGVLKRVNNSQ